MTFEKLALVFVVGLTLLLDPVQAWSGKPGSPVGLWQGIDTVDGSIRTISITGPDEEGVFEVLANDTFWTLCEGSRGLQRAHGPIDDDGVLRTEGSLECANGESLEEVWTYTPGEGSESGLLLEDTVGTPFSATLFRLDQPSRRAR